MHIKTSRGYLSPLIQTGSESYQWQTVITVSSHVMDKMHVWMKNGAIWGCPDYEMKVNKLSYKCDYNFIAFGIEKNYE